MNNSEVKMREFFGVMYPIVESTTSGNAFPFWETLKQRETAEYWDEHYKKANKIHMIEYKAYQSLQKENESLKARVGVLENCLERFLSHSRECADDFNNTFEDLCSDTRKALKEGLDDSL